MCNFCCTFAAGNVHHTMTFERFFVLKHAVSKYRLQLPTEQDIEKYLEQNK